MTENNPAPARALILAGDTDGNLGDLAIVTATIEALRELAPNIHIALVTGQPERDQRELGITPIQRGWRGMIALATAARKADLIICGGGGLFQDDDSLIKMPYWAIRLVIVGLFAPRIVGYSIGAGPLNHAWSRFFARIALSRLQRISVRDRLAQETLAPLTHKPVDIVPDPAFMLNIAPRNLAIAQLENAGVPLDGKPVIGVSVKRSFHTDANIIPHKYAVKYRLRKIPGEEQMRVNTELTAAALDTMAAEHEAYILFLPTYTAPHENDVDICRRVWEQMQTQRHACLVIDDPRLYKSVCRELSVMLGGRMHAAILAAGAGTPVVGLGYNPKFAGMFELLGRDAQCLSLEKFVAGSDPGPLAAQLNEAIITSNDSAADTQPLADAARRNLGELLAGR